MNTRNDYGTVYPPRSVRDVLEYIEQDHDKKMVEGYRDYRQGMPDPGNNRSHAYRWGWSNAKSDFTKCDDGMNHIRWELARVLCYVGASHARH